MSPSVEAEAHHDRVDDRKGLLSQFLLIRSPQRLTLPRILTPTNGSPIYWRFTGGSERPIATQEDLWRQKETDWDLTRRREPSTMGWEWRFSPMRA